MTSKPLVHSTYVPSDGPKYADIMVVGEAPGKEEEEQGRPFAAREGRGPMNAGDLINSYFRNRCGIAREQVYYTNLAKYRPYKNSFRNLLDTDQLAEGLVELTEEIQQVNPKVIIASGAWPMYFLTGKTNDKGEVGTGIMNWRRSVVKNTLVEDGPKVICSLHPAYILRNWRWHPIFAEDLIRAVEESKFSEIRYPEYELLIDPDDDDLLEELRHARYLSCDAETFGPELACFGFADSEKRGAVFTFRNPALEDITAYLLTGPARKILQYGTYDRNWSKRFIGVEIENVYFDTYVAAASLLPEFPRGLDFLISVYTRFAYYKEERKIWKETTNLDLLWQYNGKDIIGTYIVAMAQMKDLAELHGWKEAKC